MHHANEKPEEKSAPEADGACPSSHSAVRDRIRAAREQFATRGEELVRDPLISELLGALREKIEATWRVMQSIGIVATCRHCDEEEGGSCCGAGIESRYGVHLLLVNLLLGSELPERCRDPRSCLFLGPRGCMLKARHVLCVNYLCDKIEKNLEPEGRIALQDVSGEELDLAFLLQEAVIRFLRR